MEPPAGATAAHHLATSSKRVGNGYTFFVPYLFLLQIRKESAQHILLDHHIRSLFATKRDIEFVAMSFVWFTTTLMCTPITHSRPALLYMNCSIHIGPLTPRVIKDLLFGSAQHVACNILVHIYEMRKHSTYKLLFHKCLISGKVDIQYIKIKLLQATLVVFAIQLIFRHDNKFLFLTYKIVLIYIIAYILINVNISQIHQKAYSGGIQYFCFLSCPYSVIPTIYLLLTTY